MKIGTLTLHRSQNYGGLLQAYALQTVLKNAGFESEIIDYWYQGSDKALYGAKFRSAKSFKGKLRCVADGLLDSIGNIREQKALRIQRSIDFIKPHLSEDSYPDYESLKNAADSYDAFICGSDQVWNPFFMASDAAFRLEFVSDDVKRISYAASFGVSSFTDSQKSVYGPPLEKFDRISVREKDGLNIVRDVAGKDSELVLDPTLLLTKEEWLKLVPQEKAADEYIFCYFLGESKANLGKVYDYRGKKPMPIFSAGYHPLKVLNPRYKSVCDAGPAEFLGLLAGASIVFTNSFHGTVFSILFEKPFYSFVDTNKSRKAISSRIHSLTEMLGVNDRICGPERQAVDEPIDYDHAASVLQVERKKSLKFLMDALEADHD